MRQEKGSALLISILFSAVIIAGITVFLWTHTTSTQTVSNYKQDIDKAKEAQIRSDFTNLKTFLEVYHSQKEKYPDSLEDLVTEKLVPAIPKNPYTDEPYDYSTTAGTYILSTKLGDGKEFSIGD